MALPNVEAILYVELLGKDRKAVEERFHEVMRDLSREKFKVKRLDVGDVIEDPAMEPLAFSAFIEAQVVTPLDRLCRAVVRYSPTMVEVQEPGRIEVPGEILSKLIQDLIEDVSEVIREHNYSLGIPHLKDVPDPRIGFTEDELWELVYQGRNLFYSIVLRLRASDEETVKKVVPKVLLLEGVGVNSIDILSNGEFVVRVEAVSSIESLVNVAIKYLPGEVGILEPESVDITAPELQNCLSDIGSFVSSVRLSEERREACERDVFSFGLSKSI
jgi:hypothetical protein